MADFSKLKTARRTLGKPPAPAEASTNLDQPEVAPATAEPITALEAVSTARRPLTAAMTPSYQRPDGRSMRRSNRVLAFATRVTPEFDQRIREIAQRDGLLIVEVLERALEAYEGQHLSSIKKAPS